MKHVAGFGMRTYMKSTKKPEHVATRSGTIMPVRYVVAMRRMVNSKMISEDKRRENTRRDHKQKEDTRSKGGKARVEIKSHKRGNIRGQVISDK